MIRRDSRVIVINTVSVHCDRTGSVDSEPGSDGIVAVRLDGSGGTLWFESHELAELHDPKPSQFLPR